MVLGPRSSRTTALACNGIGPPVDQSITPCLALLRAFLEPWVHRCPGRAANRVPGEGARGWARSRRELRVRLSGDTRVGSIDLPVPSLRDCTYSPSSPVERRRHPAVGRCTTSPRSRFALFDSSVNAIEHGRSRTDDPALMPDNPPTAKQVRVHRIGGPAGGLGPSDSATTGLVLTQPGEAEFHATSWLTGRPACILFPWSESTARSGFPWGRVKFTSSCPRAGTFV